MRTLLLAVIAIALPLTSSPGQDTGELSPAEQIVELTGFESAGFDAARAAFRPVIDEFRAEGYDAKVLQKIESAADAFFRKVMSDPALKTGAAKFYKDSFSDEELEELLAFYQTPLGRKALTRLPRILEDSRTLGQELAEKHAPAFQDQLTDILAEANATPHTDTGAPDDGHQPAARPTQATSPTTK